MKPSIAGASATEVPREISREKSELRSLLRAARRAMTDEEHLATSWTLSAVVLALIGRRPAGSVLAFWPIASQREPDIRPVLDELLDRGVTVGLPVVRAEPGDGSSATMQAHRYAGRSHLKAGSWGVFEPDSGIPVPRESVSVILVPALALDADGYRLGYGMGHYDRYLVGLDALKIGIVFESGYRCCSLPVEPHDVPVDLVVTERRIVRTLAATWRSRERTERSFHSHSANEYPNPKTFPR